MTEHLCLNCFRVKNQEGSCPFCGYPKEEELFDEEQLKPGTVLKNRYMIGRDLGRGGFGITYLAYDTMLGKLRAIKEFYPNGYAGREEDGRTVRAYSRKEKEFSKRKSRFIEEARNMAMFSKDREIVKVYEYIEENGTTYNIMEYIDGILLKDYLKKYGKLEEAQACVYLCALLDALEKIHKKGIVHKDVSADNIFLISENYIEIIDFGEARLQKSDSDKEMEGAVKEGYSPPEQYDSEGRIDARFDIYSAGAVMYEMLTGEKPQSSLGRELRDTLTSISKNGIKVRPELEKAVLKALSLDAENRYSSAEEFKDAVLAAQKKRFFSLERPSAPFEFQWKPVEITEQEKDKVKNLARDYMEHLQDIPEDDEPELNSFTLPEEESQFLDFIGQSEEQKKEQKKEPEKEREKESKTEPKKETEKEPEPPTPKRSSAPAPEKNTRYVTGWLVCVSGPERGYSFELADGFNTVGGSEKCDISIENDKKIDPVIHFSIVYDSRKNIFHLLPESQEKKVLLNGQIQETQTEIASETQIKAGETEFIFIAFCQGGRKWSR